MIIIIIIIITIIIIILIIETDSPVIVSCPTPFDDWDKNNVVN